MSKFGTVMIPTGSPFGEALRTQREMLSLSHKQLGALCGLDPSYISRLEGGGRVPSTKTVHLLADALDLNDKGRSWLLGLSVGLTEDDMVRVALVLLARDYTRHE